jgi:hypothetical protein
MAAKAAAPKMVVPAAPLSFLPEAVVEVDEDDEVVDELVELEVGDSQLAKVSELKLTISSALQAPPRQVLNVVSRPICCCVSGLHRHVVSSALLQPTFSTAFSKQSFYIQAIRVSLSTLKDRPTDFMLECPRTAQLGMAAAAMPAKAVTAMVNLILKEVNNK